MRVYLIEVFRTAFRISWRNKKLWRWQMLPTFAFIFLLPALVYYFITLKRYSMDFELAFPVEPRIRTIFDAGIYLFAISFSLLFVLAQIATMQSVRELEKGMTLVSFIDTMRRSFPYYWRTFGVYFIFLGAWKLIIFIFQITMLPAYRPSLNNMYYFYPINAFLFLAMLVSACVVQLAQAAIVIDNINILKAISRGWKLLLTNGWNAFPVMLTLYFGSSFFLSFLFAPLIFGIPISFFFLTHLRNLDLVLFIIYFVYMPLLIFLPMLALGIVMTLYQSTWTIFYLRVSSLEKE